MGADDRHASAQRRGSRASGPHPTWVTDRTGFSEGELGPRSLQITQFYAHIFTNSTILGLANLHSQRKYGIIGLRWVAL
jgi:hypothetical protein